LNILEEPGYYTTYVGGDGLDKLLFSTPPFQVIEGPPE